MISLMLYLSRSLCECMVSNACCCEQYGLLVPLVAHSVYKLSKSWKAEVKLDLLNLSILPTLLLRLLHGQLWITVSRFQTARSRRAIVRRSIDYEQVDRESNWDDNILLAALLSFAVNIIFHLGAHMPWWEMNGVLIVALFHMGPVEFLYYWFHRALHHHLLYSRYHSHHHASIATQPITAVVHPFAEIVVYFILFFIPVGALVLTGTGSISVFVGYLSYIDFMNYMGHCNFEIVPLWLFDAFPPLKYLMYTPSFHSLHHTQFRTNYSLFMPFYDYIYDTVDKSTDKLHQSCVEGKDEEPNVVHLTHMSNFHSIYHLRLGISSVSSQPYSTKWYMWLLWPLTWASFLLTCFYGSTFTVEKNRMKKLVIETWTIPRYAFQYKLRSQREAINDLIEKAILDAQKKGASVITLGLLNQGEEMNGCGKLYIENNPKLKIKIVDGTSLAAAVVLNSIPKGTKQILLVGSITKMSFALTHALAHKGVEILMTRRDEYDLMKKKLPQELHQHLIFSKSHGCQVWLVDDGLKDEEQRMASKDSHFIPFSQFPPKILRKDCTYYGTPALKLPKSYENQHTCENWLPRRAMSAWRAAGILHGLEGWEAHECGVMVLDIEKVWHAAINHGFLPLEI